ncbi:MAG TPA: hypothetical protein VEC60_05190, partial [Reyranella sp.]|nr:hypothetical protein [Reyranella sp.]
MLAACTQSASSGTASNLPPAQPAAIQKVQWRALVAAGDDSISVFDNAVDEMTQILSARGVSRIDRFTSDPTMVASGRMIA